MRRREFITLLVSAIAGCSARAASGRDEKDNDDVIGLQVAAIPVIGFIGISSPSAVPELLAAFHRGLSEMGYAEGQNVKIEYRCATGGNSQVKCRHTEASPILSSATWS
jgi:hypothetical protein